MDVLLKRPKECTPEELASFARMVRLGEQVDGDAGLAVRIAKAALLAFAVDEGKVVGVGAMKNPGPQSRAGIFDKASYKTADIELAELGWISVDPERQNQGISKLLVSKLVEEFDGPAYATSRSSRAAMHKTLRRFGFQDTGNPYEPLKNKADKLLLFVKAKQD